MRGWGGYLPTCLPTRAQREVPSWPASGRGLPGPTPSCPEERCEEGGARARRLFAELSTLWLWRPPLLCSLVVVVVVGGARESAHAAEAWRGACRTAATARRSRQCVAQRILVRRRSLCTGNGARAGGGWFADEDLEAKPPGRPLRAPDGVKCTFQYRD